MRSRRLPRNGCRASISCLRLRRAKRSLLGRTASVDGAIAVVPNVAPRDAPLGSASRRRGGGRRDILFVGNMSYLPNIDAAMWFASRIWPKLRCAVPFPIRFVIAGSGAPREVTDLARRPGIVVAGGCRRCRAALPARGACRRADQGRRRHAHQAAWKAQATAFPSWRRGLARQGTGLRSGQELLLADNERDFATSCARLLTDGQASIAAGGAGPAGRSAGTTMPRRCAARLLATIDAYCDTGVKRR